MGQRTVRKRRVALCYFTDANHTIVYRAGVVEVDNYQVDWTASGYRLPTEAEWEVAARGGLASNDYAWGDSPFPTKANYLDSGIGKASPVGSFPANGFGIYDIGGNYANGFGTGRTTARLTMILR